MSRVWESFTIEGLEQIAKDLLTEVADRKVICFHGDLGAGKTTFIKEICKVLGVSDQVQSPTFSIVNEYATPSGDPVYHFDFYRLKNESEAYDLGYEEYLYSDYFCFVEWPEKISGLPMPERADVYIEVTAGKRLIRLVNE